MKHSAAILIFFIFGMMASCSRQDAADTTHLEENAVYYWRTAIDCDSAETAFIRQHNIKRMYLRMFDVVADNSGNYDDFNSVPNATLKFGRNASVMLDSLDIIPTVYITVEALRAEGGNEAKLAALIVERVANMCSYNGLNHIKELQLDCDWTTSTRRLFYKLCDEVNKCIAKEKLGWDLSSTIRLHQLAQTPPPVARGVLMVYNTGSFDNPDAENSIIDINDVRPYLKRLHRYPLHLDIAYPTYSWQLLFHGRKFVGLLNGIDTADSLSFEQLSAGKARAIKDIPYRDKMINTGDILRTESSPSAQILAIKTLIDNELTDRPHSNILYHLSIDNLSKYSKNEIDSILSR